MSQTCVRLCLMVLLWTLAWPVGAQRIALTFDDGFDPRVDAQAQAANARILNVLNASGIRAMFFPAGFMVDSPAGLALVADWSQAGHAIGNHTYSHQAFSDFPAGTQAFFDDVLRGQSLFEKLAGWCPRLRYPYLDEGRSPELKNVGIQWLAQHGYGVASATIFIDDWAYNERFVASSRGEAGNDEPHERQAYLERIWQQASLQETQWSQQLGRSPAHVLLLHANSLNARLLPDIVQMFLSKGWTFEDPIVAFADPVYSREFTQDGQTRVLPMPACH